MSAKIGFDINLYFDEQGSLLITDQVRPDLRAIPQSRDFRVNAPLTGPVTVEVEVLIDKMDITVPLDQARFIIGDSEVDADMVREVKAMIGAKRSAAAKAATAMRT